MKQYFKAHLVKNTTPFGYVIADKLRDLSEGFWINRLFKFTKVSDGRHWIPPHKIDYIELVKTDDDNNIIEAMY